MKTIQTTIAFLLLLIFAMSCSNDEETKDPSTISKDVYVAGYIIDNNLIWIATVWKNGTPTYLTSGTNFSEANDVIVVGNDVYVVGKEKINGKETAKMWKNGIGTNLSDGFNDETAIAIQILGNDIYVIGHRYEDNRTISKVWKNGIATNLPALNPMFREVPTSICISGNDVFVSGSSSFGTDIYAKTWKNSVATTLTSANGQANATDILVLGTDVYVVGRINGKAKCWKNNILTTNLIKELDSYEAVKIANIGTDIYILGYQIINSLNQIKIWKNGNTIDFPIATDLITATDLALSGSDIYVCADKKVGSKTSAIYYKNQVEINLVNDAVLRSYANAIFVK